MSDDLDAEALGELVRHLVVDFVGGAGRDHLEELFQVALATSRQQAYMTIVLTCSLTSRLMRATLADTLAIAEALGAESFWGLTVQPHPDTDLNAPEVRAKRSVMQAITAQLNEDRDTAAALIMALVKADDGVELAPFALVAALDTFAGCYNTPEGREAAVFLGLPSDLSGVTPFDRPDFDDEAET